MKPDPSKLLNYAELSAQLSGGRKSITHTRIPKMHQKKIDELKGLVQKWIDKYL